MSINSLTFLSNILPGVLSQCAWTIPEYLSEEDWVKHGAFLGTLDRSVSWWLGDWWVFGEHKYGGRKDRVEREDWNGPDYGTCANVASVCRAFESSRRRDNLTFSHHVEVASISSENPKRADNLLDWCAETIPENGRPRSIRELREYSNRLESPGIQPSDDTCTEEDLSILSDSGKRFGCIYADPPWLYDNQGTRAATGNHYHGMTVEEIAALPIGDLAAPDAHLHLWTTNGFLFEAPKIFAAWGFEFRSSFIWVKPQIGIGNYWRNAHEILLTAIKGKAKRFNDKSLKSWLECKRGEHSAKPDQVRSFVQRASPGPYLELFGRSKVKGWTVWGNQIEKNLFHADPVIVPFTPQNGPTTRMFNETYENEAIV